LFHNKQLVATPRAVEDFVHLAAAKGLYIDDFIRMAESGMAGSRSLTPSCLPMHSRKRAGVPCFLESSAP
jgi:hypothetical protein